MVGVYDAAAAAAESYNVIICMEMKNFIIQKRFARGKERKKEWMRERERERDRVSETEAVDYLITL